MATKKSTKSDKEFSGAKQLIKAKKARKKALEEAASYSKARPRKKKKTQTAMAPPPPKPNPKKKKVTPRPKKKSPTYYV